MSIERWGRESGTDDGASAGAGAGRVRRVALLALLVAGPAGGVAHAGGSVVRDLTLEGLGADARPARLVIEGGAPHGVGSLLLQGPAGAALQPIRLDHEGRYESGLRPRERAAIDAVRVRFEVASEAAGGAAWAGWRRYQRPPGLGGVPQAGEIVITEIMKDPTWVSDSDGEWVEIVNTGATPRDLEGWTLADHGSDSHVIDNGGAGVVVAPGQRFVLGIQDDPVLNGGVQVDYRYAGFSLSNGADEVVLLDGAGALVDEVVYDNGVLWPDTPGEALSLTPAATGVVANDDPASWCSAQSQINLVNPDKGTPGQVNDVCP